MFTNHRSWLSMYDLSECECAVNLSYGSFVYGVPTAVTAGLGRVVPPERHSQVGHFPRL